MSTPTLLRILLRTALDEVEQDALVTKQHADDLADQLTDALVALGMRVEQAMQLSVDEPQPWEGELMFEGSRVYRDFGWPHGRVDITDAYRAWVSEQPMIERVVTAWTPVEDER